MEVKAELQKPYTEEQRVTFIIEQNHRKGYIIEEKADKLVALGYTEEEIKEQERERIGNLTLTAADVERAIYKAKGMDFEDVISLVEGKEGIDVKALKIELKANNFYRKNPYVNAVGKILGFTEEQLDYLFEHKEFAE